MTREWTIPSGSRPGLTHRVGLAGGRWYCTCEAGRFGRECRHIRSVKASEHRADLRARLDRLWREIDAATAAGDADGCRAAEAEWRAVLGEYERAGADMPAGR